jgi:hypothetical protein
MVACAADQVVKPGALAPEDKDAVAREVELVVIGRAPLVEPDDPEVPLFELFQSTNKINDTGDAQVFGRACTSLYHNGAQWGGPALSQENAVDAGAVGNAKQST